MVLPVSYWRTQEFAYVGRQLLLAPGARVLDLGSPKELASMLALWRGYEMVATDILPEAIELSDRYARALGVEGRGAGKVFSEVQDGRQLTYADASFDGVFSVSVIEHIPGEGDSAAVAELVRVVRPGGRIVITTPYATAYRETFVNRGVYERSQRGDSPVFYERHYDDAALQKRVFGIKDVRVVDRQLWGERGPRVEHALTRSRRLRTLLSPFEPLLSIVSLRALAPAEGRPMAAFLTLERRAG